MLRSIMLLVLAAFFISTLTGCIVDNGHHRGLFPWGHVKKSHGNNGHGNNGHD